MTNEELALRIREGHTEHTVELWTQVARFIALKAKGFCGRLASPHGVTPEDLTQVGFLALIDAVNTFDRDKGYSFLSWLNLHLKGHFYEAAGLRTERSRRDPINTALSLDVPLTADTQDTLADVVADPEDPYEETEHMICREQLRKALENALDELPEKEATAIRMRFFDCLTLREAGDQAGVTPERIRQLERKALRKLRQNARSNGLEKYLDELTVFYRNTSFNNTWMSPTEAIVMRREDLRKRIIEKGY